MQLFGNRSVLINCLGNRLGVMKPSLFKMQQKFIFSRRIVNQSSIASSPRCISKSFKSTLSAKASPETLHETAFSNYGGNDNLPESNLIHTMQSSGSRLILMNDSYKSNELSTTNLDLIKKIMNTHHSNHTIGALMFGSNIPEIFSLGLPFSEINRKKEIEESLMESVQQIILKLTSYPITTIAMFDGDVVGTAFATFATSTYRIATPNTKFFINELQNGWIPLGGLSYHLARSCRQGKAIARYLAITGRPLSSHDMYELGLATHVTETQPYLTLMDAIRQTLPMNDMIKSYQNQTVDPAAIGDLLDTMDVYHGSSRRAHKMKMNPYTSPTSSDSSIDTTTIEISPKTPFSSMFDEEDDEIFSYEISKDDIWKKVLLVDPDPINMDQLFSEDYDEKLPFNLQIMNDLTSGKRPSSSVHYYDKEDLEDIYDPIEKCFDMDNVQDCRIELQAFIDSHWNEHSSTLADFEKVKWATDSVYWMDQLENQHPNLLQEWFDLTSNATKANASIRSILEMEKAIVDKLSKS